MHLIKYPLDIELVQQLAIQSTFYG